MSNPGNNSHNRKLKELLDKNGQPENLPADDFEKEALEGFAMLGNDEAMELKQTLDAKMYNTVFTSQQPKKSYWLAAAAGLVLIIGFSVYFTRNTMADTERKEVAIVAPQKEEEQVPTSMPAPPAITVDEKAEEPAPKPMARAQSKAELESVTTNLPEQKPAMATAHSDFGSADKEEKFTSSGGINSAAPMHEPPAEMDVIEAESDKTIKAKDVEKEPEALVSEKKQSRMAVTPEATQYTTPQMNASGALSPQWTSNSAMAPAATLTCNIQPVFVLCTYTGGDAALQKDVKEKLAAKNLAQKFDAVVYINTSNVVEKVKLTKTYALSKVQQQEVIALLKTLTKFKVDAGVKKTVEYGFGFRP